MTWLTIARWLRCRPRLMMLSAVAANDGGDGLIHLLARFSPRFSVGNWLIRNAAGRPYCNPESSYQTRLFLRDWLGG